MLGFKTVKNILPSALKFIRKETVIREAMSGFAGQIKGSFHAT